jgi:hypothetical protein
MNPNNCWHSRWHVVYLYTVAMAWVEAAVVYYLRTLVDRIEPYQPHPLPISAGLGEAELVREAATLVMLFTVGWLAGSTWRSRAGYTLLAFGVWDVFYYVFLRIMTGWPNSILDWDILFLIPLPWWGPVIAPLSIAILMILFGTIVAGSDAADRPLWPRTLSSIAGILGVLLGLYVFMSDAIHSADKSATALRELLPVRFDWPKFGFALLLLAAPVVDVIRQRTKRREAKTVPLTTGEPSRPVS